MTDPTNPAPPAEELRELLAKATPGRWRVGRQNGAPRDHLVDMGEPPKSPYFRMHKGIPESSVTRGSPAFGIVESDDAPAEEIAANAALIVAAVNALPTLLDHLSVLTVENERMRGIVAYLADRLPLADELNLSDTSHIAVSVGQLRAALSSLPAMKGEG